MGVEEIGQGDSMPHNPELTIADLIDIYGEEPVRRGLQYMDSLKDADQKFREAASSERMKEGYEEAYDIELNEDEEAAEGAEKWAEAMEDDGLGIEEE